MKWIQDRLPYGTPCWVLHPNTGFKAIAEGVALHHPESILANGRESNNLLLQLESESTQYVQITYVHKKGTPLLHIVQDSGIYNIGDVLSPPAPTGTYIKWSTRYLVPMEDFENSMTYCVP